MPFSRLTTLSVPERYAAAFALGAVMALAMPPTGSFPVLLASVPGFMILSAAAKTRRAAFLTGWAFGAGYFIAGLYWVSAALFVDIALWGWLLPFTAVLGPVAFALWYGLIPLPAWRYRKNPAAHAFVFAASWAAVEWLRGHLLTGFPWNLPGYAWMHLPPVMQVSAFTGIYGLSLLTLLWAAVPVFMDNKKLSRGLVWSFAAVALLGAVRLDMTPARPSGSTVRIVQPNIPEGQKWDEGRAWSNLEFTLELSRLEPPVTFVVWPETAAKADLGLNPRVAKRIADGLPQGSHGILGTLRVRDDGRTAWNSVTLTEGGRVVDVYDKHHLVPFGEYVPFRGALNLTPVAAAISGIGDFSRGGGPRTLEARGLPPFSPLICYEVIFPGAVADRDNRPAWLVNVTNDAWYGKTAGPHQHFETARVRAIEEGLPLARSANTGISGMIDPAGRVIAKIPLGIAGAVDAPLPAPLEPTVYVRMGDWVFGGMLIAVFAFGEVLRRRKKP